MADVPDQIKLEQQGLDRRYARLDELRAQMARRLAEVRRTGPTGSPQNRSERDAFATLYEDRLSQLEAVEDRLCFGRLDMADDSTLYIGRIGLTDAAHQTLLTDWRAPAAQPFYRATAREPLGARRRRHLFTRGRQVEGIEDEALDLDTLDQADVPQLRGEGALMAAMAAKRTGRMRDIVATIQREQDEIIRAPLQGCLVVQGGPGTGKTAVALHRAAYLLYTNRQMLQRSGVLLIGPSQVFLRYIDQVLPSLGETGVVVSTIADLLPGLSARGEDSPVAAEIKGRGLMAKVIARAVRLRQRSLPAPRHLRVEGVDVVIRPRDISAAQERARRTGRPYNQARTTFVREMLRRLVDQHAATLDYPLDEVDRAALTEDLRSNRDVRVTLNLAWMPMTPQALVEQLWADPQFLADAAPELSATECATLARPRGAQWTVSDVPLLDEAAELLGEDDSAARARARADEERRSADLSYAREVLSATGNSIVSAQVLADRFAAPVLSGSVADRAAVDRTWVYGHVVVDEAQELSAMAWRMIARRCPSGSMTLVGDLAQRHERAGVRDWVSVARRLAKGRDRVEVRTLTVNYRTPADVMELAEKWASSLGMPVAHLTSARSVPDAVVQVSALNSAEAVVQCVGEELAHDDPGRVAVIAVPAAVHELNAALLAGGLGEAVSRGPGDGDAQVVVIDPREAKGLEFDVVVVVDPGEIAVGEAGPADLYVAMTRPTRRLYVVEPG